MNVLKFLRNGLLLGPEPIQIRLKIKKNRIGTIRYLGHMDKSGQKNLVYLGLGNIQKLVCTILDWIFTLRAAD